MNSLWLCVLIFNCRILALPNFVFLLTDDQDLTLRSLDFLNNTVELVANAGVTFTNYYVNSPICCPSRSTILTEEVSGLIQGWYFCSFEIVIFKMAVLETSMTSKTREDMEKTQKNNKKQDKKVLVVAQELRLARCLAGNNKHTRDRALKSLKKWFHNRSATIPYTEDDFLRLWKGLFYSMWMSDKPLIQEECAENISSLVHDLPFEASLQFYKCGMTILMNEWFGIDQHRLDKFLMFVRRLLRQALFVLKSQNWMRQTINKFTEVLSDTILDYQRQKPMGLLMHFIEIYLEELAKVSEGVLPPQLMTELLAPFITQMAFTDDPRIIDHIRKHVFVYLIRQSDLGLEYDEKYRAWRSLGFPGTIDAMQKVEVSDDETNDIEEEETGEKVYDPRAGKVDVTLPQLKFHSRAIAKALLGCRFAKETNSKSRKCLIELAEHFRKLASGVYPLGVKKIKLASVDHDTNIKKAVNRLVKFDKKIKGKKDRKRKIHSDEMELRGGKKIKIDEKLREMFQNELNNVMKKKRKVMDPQLMGPSEKKVRLEVESIFKRNSGTWLVTKAIQQESNIVKSKRDKLLENTVIARSIDKVSPDKKLVFPKNTWEESNNHTSQEIERSLKKNRLSLPAYLIKNPFANSTPVKKVKINTKLNKSQDVQEHHAQILSSPAIPYDANKKPSKPLLKASAVKSPINPFYKIV